MVHAEDTVASPLPPPMVSAEKVPLLIVKHFNQLFLNGICWVGSRTRRIGPKN